METPDSISVEMFGMKAAATGSLAIIALLLTVSLAAAVFLIGRKRAWW
jgi:hypothetical protein